MKCEWRKSPAPGGVGASTRPEEAAQAYVEANTDISSAVAAKQPSIILFLSAEENKDTGRRKTSVPLPQTRFSEEVRRRFILGDGKDYRPVIAGKYFTKIAVDLTGITPDKNPVFCSENAPLIALVDPEGKVDRLFQGHKECLPDKVLPRMIDLIEDMGIKGIAKSIKKIDRLLTRLVKTEANLARIRDRTKKKAGDSDEPDEATARIEQEKHELMREEYQLLKDNGCPESALPPQPPKN